MPSLSLRQTTDAWSVRIGSSADWEGITFLPGCGEAMRITKGGNVGIWTRTPNAYLDIGGKTRLHIDGVDDLLVKEHTEIGGQIYVDGSGDNYFAGAIGIGTAEPQQKLHISGVMRLEPQSVVPNGNLGDLYVGTDGKLYFHFKEKK